MQRRFGTCVFLASRPKFLAASAAPVLVGSALGYAAQGQFHTLLFCLALFSIMALHAGANMANDYFDHISGNDWVNKNPTPFSGGSRYIQEGLLSPRATLAAALVALVFAAIAGLVIVLLTRSVFILLLGLAGMSGGFFYTAPPLKLGYRSTGEVLIGLLFGIGPVYGSYYLQTATLNLTPLLPALIVAVLIFLVILVNEFADVDADRAANKRTLVVCFGVRAGIWIYRVALIVAYGIAVAQVIASPLLAAAGWFYLLTLPLAALAIRAVNSSDLTTHGQYLASQITVLLHSIGCLALAAGFLVAA